MAKSNSGPHFKADGYLEKASLDKHGGKHITLEFSSEVAYEIAKLELMGRDLKEHNPVLLTVSIKVTKDNSGTIGKEGSQKSSQKVHR